MLNKRYTTIVIVILFAVIFISAYIYIIHNPSAQTKQIQSFNELSELDNIVSVNKLEEYELKSLFKEGTDVDRVLVYEIHYITGDGADVLGYISAPSDYLQKDYPVLIYNRGDQNITKSYDKRQLIRLGAVLSTANISFETEFEGCITLSSFYRNGDHLAKGEKYDQIGGDDLNDVIALIDMSENFSFTNGKKYMIGNSRGGMMTYMLLRADNRIDAAVVFAGIGDMAWIHENNRFSLAFEVAIGGKPDELPKEYEDRSAIYWADEIETPLLILHGKDDEIVLVDDSIKIYEKMEIAEKNVELILYDGVGHELTDNMFTDAFEFLSLY